MGYYNRNIPLSDQELMQCAPSVFASQQHSNCGDKYRFLPTIDVLNKLKTSGWQPIHAIEQHVRREDRQGFQKHMIYLRNFDMSPEKMSVGDTVLEAILINAHDTSSSYSLSIGLMRMVCTNQLIVSESSFESMRIRHVGFNPDEVINATYKIVEAIPSIKREVTTMQQIQLTPNEEQAFANSALMVRYDDEYVPIKPDQLLRRRHHEDTGKTDLWTAYNSIQENLMKGGLSGRAESNRRVTTRKIKGIDQNVRLNKALWTLAMQMKQLKSS